MDEGILHGTGGIMHAAWTIILGVMGAYFFMEGVTVLNAAQSAMHQIYGSVLMLAFTVCITGIGIIQTLKVTQIKQLRVVDSQKKKVETNGTNIGDMFKDAASNLKQALSGVQDEDEPFNLGPAVPTTRYCHLCGTDLPLDAIACPTCTHHLSEHPQFCPRCGHEITHRPNLCPGCGGKFRYKDQSDESTS